MKKLISLFPLILTLMVISCTNPNNTDNNNQMDQPIDTAERLDSLDSVRIDSTLTEQPINPVE